MESDRAILAAIEKSVVWTFRGGSFSARERSTKMVAVG